MKDTDRKKLRGIFDAVRFDGKPTEHALSQAEQIFDNAELEAKHRREETRLFYLASICISIFLTVMVVSCYQSV